MVIYWIKDYYASGILNNMAVIYWLLILWSLIILSNILSIHVQLLYSSLLQRPCNVKGSKVDLTQKESSCNAYWLDQWPLWVSTHLQVAIVNNLRPSKRKISDSQGILCDPTSIISCVGATVSLSSQTVN